MISITQLMAVFIIVIFIAMAIIELTGDKPIPAWLVKALKIPEEDEDEPTSECRKQSR